MSILEDMLSRDATRIWKACGDIRRTRDEKMLLSLAAELDRIKKSTKTVKLGGMLRPNSSHLEFAIRKIEFVRDREGCLCGLYALDDMIDPNREESDGNIVILETVETPERFVDFYRCECKICGTIFRTTEREYHYTWWKWEREENFPEKDS